MLLNSGEKVNSKSLLLTVSNNNDNLHAAYVQVWCPFEKSGKFVDLGNYIVFSLFIPKKEPTMPQIRDFKIQRRGRQWERQKNNSFN